MSLTLRYFSYFYGIFFNFEMINSLLRLLISIFTDIVVISVRGILN